MSENRSLWQGLWCTNCANLFVTPSILMTLLRLLPLLCIQQGLCSAADAGAELDDLQVRKEALEKQKKLMQLVASLRTVSSTGSTGVFQQIALLADEGEEYLRKAELAATDAEKVAILSTGLAKRQDWVEKLLEAKDAVMDEAPSDDPDDLDFDDAGERIPDPEPDDADSSMPNDAESSRDEEADALIADTAKQFQVAVREGNVQVIAKFMQALGGTPGTLQKIVNWGDKVGATTLHWCAFYGDAAHVGLAKTFMMLPGVNASALDTHNQSPCHTACMKGHSGVLEHLINESARATSCDPFKLSAMGSNCLHLAAQKGDLSLMSVLKPLLNKETVNVRTSSKSPTSALFLAAEAGSLDIVKILMESGASSSLGRQVDNGQEESPSERIRQLQDSYSAILKELETQPGKHKEARSDL